MGEGREEGGGGAFQGEDEVGRVGADGERGRRAGGADGRQSGGCILALFKDSLE